MQGAGLGAAEPPEPRAGLVHGSVGESLVGVDPPVDASVRVRLHMRVRAVDARSVRVEAVMPQSFEDVLKCLRLCGGQLGDVCHVPSHASDGAGRCGRGPIGVFRPKSRMHLRMHFRSSRAGEASMPTGSRAKARFHRRPYAAVCTVCSSLKRKKAEKGPTPKRGA